MYTGFRVSDAHVGARPASTDPLFKVSDVHVHTGWPLTIVGWPIVVFLVSFGRRAGSFVWGERYSRLDWTTVDRVWSLVSSCVGHSGLEIWPCHPL